VVEKENTDQTRWRRGEHPQPLYRPLPVPITVRAVRTSAVLKFHSVSLNVIDHVSHYTNTTGKIIVSVSDGRQGNPSPHPLSIFGPKG
jgi:hypothetical protein